MSTEMTKAQREEMREKKRRRMKRNRRIKIGVVVCVVLAVIIYVLSAFVFFKVSDVEVIGITDEDGNVLTYNTYYTDDEIIAASGVETGNSLLMLIKSDIAENIEHSLPYIGSVTVEKHLPHTVRLVIEETEDFYAVSDNSGYIILNRDFKVLGSYAEVPDGCAELTGVEFSETVVGETAVFEDDAYMDRIVSVTDSCEDSGITDITKYDFSNIAAVKVVSGGRITINVGTITDLEDKLALAVKTIDVELENNPDAFIIIDVSDKERAYVRDDEEAEQMYNESETEPESESDGDDFTD